MIVVGKKPTKNNKVKIWEAWFEDYLLSLKEKAIIHGPIAMTIHFIFNDNRRRDAHNLIDVICDVMQGHLYDDDSQIYKMLITKEVIKESPVTITITLESLSAT